MTRTTIALAFAAIACLSADASAAESYDSCTGYIDSLPAVIATQGTWCLRANLSTAMASGRAIEVAANNVTIDCHDFKVGGLAAGMLTDTSGIVSQDRQSTTIRSCGLRGFNRGIVMDGGGGHVVEDNRVESSRSRGIELIDTQASVARRNLVLETGGRPTQAFPTAILLDGGSGCVAEGNQVSQVAGSAEDADVYPVGIESNCNGADISDNQVSRLQVSGTGEAYGIVIQGPGIGTRVSDNFVHVLLPGTPGFAIAGPEPEVACIDNTVANFGGGILCGTASRNVTMQFAE